MDGWNAEHIAILVTACATFITSLAAAVVVIVKLIRRDKNNE